MSIPPTLYRCPTPELTIISLLLRRGADPNESSLPLSPLVYAIRSGDLGAVQRLIERGASVNHPLPSEVRAREVVSPTCNICIN